MIWLFIGLLLVHLDIDIELGGMSLPLFPSFLGFILAAIGFYQLRKDHHFFKEKDTLVFDIIMVIFSLGVTLYERFGHHHQIVLLLTFLEMILSHKQLHLISEYLDEENSFTFSCEKVCHFLLVMESLVYLLEFFHIEIIVQILEGLCIFLLGGVLLRLLDQICREEKKA